MTNDIDYLGLGKRIKQYRLKKHMTQETLANLIGVATSTIAHAESGTSKPSLPLILKIANQLNVSIDQLVCDNLPTINIYLDKDIADLISDCSTKEKAIIKDIIMTVKKTIREHR